MKTWKTCIYFQSHLILAAVNVDRVYVLRQSKDFEKKISITYLGQSAKCVCPQKNKIQHRKPVIDGIRNEKGNKNRKFRILDNTMRRKSQ